MQKLRFDLGYSSKPVRSVRLRVELQPAVIIPTAFPLPRRNYNKHSEHKLFYHKNIHDNISKSTTGNFVNHLKWRLKLVLMQRQKGNVCFAL